MCTLYCLGLYKGGTRYVRVIYERVITTALSRVHRAVLAALCMHLLHLRAGFDFERDVWQKLPRRQQVKLNRHRRRSFPRVLPLHPADTAFWLDATAGYSLTSSKIAKVYARIVRGCAVRCGLDMSTCTITDATASVGGNVFAFASHFAKVNAIELLEPTAQMLLHNLKLLKLSHKVDVWCGDSSQVDVVSKHIVQDVLFLDPPWGGVNYRRAPRLSLFLAEKNLRQICIEWARCTRLIVLKLPLKFHYSEFFHLAAQLPFVLMYRAEIGMDSKGKARALRHGDRSSPKLHRTVMSIVVLRVT